jgi:hypothetical protein
MINILATKKACKSIDLQAFNFVRPPGLEPVSIINLLSITYKESQSSGA